MGKFSFRTEEVERLHDYVVDAYTDSVGDDIDDVMPGLEGWMAAVDDELADARVFVDRVRDAVERGEDVTLFGVDYEPVGKGGAS